MAEWLSLAVERAWFLPGKKRNIPVTIPNADEALETEMWEGSIFNVAQMTKSLKEEKLSTVQVNWKRGY